MGKVGKMSVILGYKAEDKLYLAADNRLSEKDGTFICDNERKIIEINSHLAVAFAGNAGTQALFGEFVKGLKNANDFKMEDILFNIDAMFMSLKIKIMIMVFMRCHMLMVNWGIQKQK